MGWLAGAAVLRRPDLAAARAEAQGPTSLAAGYGVKDHRVAVLQETPFLARGEPDRVFAAAGGFEQAAEARVLGRGDRARSEQVARPQIAAVGGVVRDHLRHGPIHMPRVAQRDAVRA